MDLIERSISVTWRHRIHFTQGVFAVANSLLRDVLAGESPGRRARALLIVDESISRARPEWPAQIEDYFRHHGAALELACPPLIMEGGERIKNAYFHVSEIHSHIDRFHLDRQSYVICAGGGALLDMAGLAAATAHRGLRHLRLPSTTLAQADSGVGVKNGINAFGKKNFIGTFAPPFAVINDFDLLRTLSERDRRAGLVEAVKVACIKDREFFAALERDAAALARFEPGPVRKAIHRCAELHVAHIAGSGDPFEFGNARPLDFGHWAAHKLEQLSDYRLRHGEAVAIGMAVDVLYAREAGLLSPATARRILSLLRQLGFDLDCNECHYTDARGELIVLNGLEEFREHLGGGLSITLLRDLGAPVEVNAMDAALVRRAISLLSHWQ
jgi:3-dehydroquinate synthase